MFCSVTQQEPDLHTMLFCTCRYHTECVEAVCTQTNQELHQIQCWNPYCDEDARKPTPKGLVSAGPPGDSQELFIGKVTSADTVLDADTAHDEITESERPQKIRRMQASARVQVVAGARVLGQVG